MTQGSKTWNRRSVFVLAVMLIVCFAVAAVGGAVTTPKIDGWYAGLSKPWFNPPNWLFGPVWTLLYALMAIAAWRIWRTDPDLKSNRRPLALFAAQLVVNLVWSFAFFGAESPGAGLLVIIGLDILIILTIVDFRSHDILAASLLVPYAAWVAFASALNLAIYRLN